MLEQLFLFDTSPYEIKKDPSPRADYSGAWVSSEGNKITFDRGGVKITEKYNNEYEALETAKMYKLLITLKTLAR